MQLDQQFAGQGAAWRRRADLRTRPPAAEPTTDGFSQFVYGRYHVNAFAQQVERGAGAA
ncbi:hypothetical protein D9M73_236470 [compost metagenome]